MSGLGTMRSILNEQLVMLAEDADRLRRRIQHVHALLEMEGTP